MRDIRSLLSQALYVLPETKLEKIIWIVKHVFLLIAETSLIVVAHFTDVELLVVVTLTHVVGELLPRDVIM